MKIAGLSYRLGSKIVTNQDLIEKVRQESNKVEKTTLDKICKQISFYFNYAGCQQRRWLAEDETAIGLTQEAIKEAVAEANCELKDIDLLLHVGLGRGFLEAGQSYFVAQAMGMHKVDCFDIMDACNSWSRGLMVAYNFLKSNVYKNILIVNTECNVLPGGIINPRLFQFDRFEDINASFAGLTLADGVAATVVTQSDQPWRFHFQSSPDLADVCAVPLPTYKSFSLPSDYLAYNGPLKFTSFAKIMHEKGHPQITALFHKVRDDLNVYKHFFTHGHTYHTWVKDFTQLGVPPEKYKWNTFVNYGNLASACVPVSIKMAVENGDLLRGDRMATIVGSGGMSFSVIDTVY